MSGRTLSRGQTPVRLRDWDDEEGQPRGRVWRSVNWRRGKQAEALDRYFRLRKLREKLKLPLRIAEMQDSDKEVLRDLEAEWENITTINFVEELIGLAPLDLQADYLEMLSIEVINPSARALHLRRDDWAKAYDLKIRLSDYDGGCFFSEDSSSSDDDTFEISQTTSEPRRRCCDFGQGRLLFHVAYTTCHSIFNPHGPKEMSYIVKTLLEAHIDAGVAATLPGHILLKDAYQRTKWILRIRIMTNLLGMICIMLTGSALRHGNYPSCLGIISVIIFNSIIPCFRLLSEVVGAQRHYGGLYGIKKILSRYTVGSILTELYVAVFVIMVVQGLSTRSAEVNCSSNADRARGVALSFHGYNEAVSPLMKGVLASPCPWLRTDAHMLFIFCFKGMDVLTSLFITRSIGESLMPAYYAMTHKSSLMFLVFLLLSVVCTTCMYVVLTDISKIEDFTMQKGSAGLWGSAPEFGGWNVFTLFNEMFSLAMVGNYDPHKIQGLHSELYLAENFTSMEHLKAGDVFARMRDAEINENEAPPLYFSSHVFAMSAVLIINVVLLNMYVGVLGYFYQEAYERRLEHVFLFRSAFAWKALLSLSNWRKFYNTFFARFLGKTRLPDERVPMMIAYNPSWFNTAKSEKMRERRQQMSGAQDTYDRFVSEYAGRKRGASARDSSTQT